MTIVTLPWSRISSARRITESAVLICGALMSRQNSCVTRTAWTSLPSSTLKPKRSARRPDMRGLDVPPELVRDAYRVDFVAELDPETEALRALPLLVDDPLYLGSEQ